MMLTLLLTVVSGKLKISIQSKGGKELRVGGRLTGLYPLRSLSPLTSLCEYYYSASSDCSGLVKCVGTHLRVRSC